MVVGATVVLGVPAVLLVLVVLVAAVVTATVVGETAVAVALGGRAVVTAPTARPDEERAGGEEAPGATHRGGR